MIFATPDESSWPTDIKNKVTDLGLSLGSFCALARRIVVIGEPSADRDSFCRLLDGSLRQHPPSLCETNGSTKQEANPKLTPCRWLGQDGDDELPLLLADLPASDDVVRELDLEEDMVKSVKWLRSLHCIHGVALVLRHEPRISHALQTRLDFFQRVFGRGLWSHIFVVVNQWSHCATAKQKRKNGDAPTADEVEAKIRDFLQLPRPRDAQEAGSGLGLTKEEAARIPFYFVDPHFSQENDEEKRSMDMELRQLKLRLSSCEPWEVEGKTQITQSCTVAFPPRQPNFANNLEKDLRDTLKTAGSWPADVLGQKAGSPKGFPHSSAEHIYRVISFGGFCAFDCKRF